MPSRTVESEEEARERLLEEFASESDASDEAQSSPEKRGKCARCCRWTAVILLFLVISAGAFVYWRWRQLTEDNAVPWDNMTPAVKPTNCPYDPNVTQWGGGGSAMTPAHRPHPPVLPPLSTCSASTWLDLCWPQNLTLSYAYFEVASDNWWQNDTSIETIVCKVKYNSSCRADHLLPATLYHMKLRAWVHPPAGSPNATAPDAVSSVGRATTGNAGGCGNAADIAAWRAAKATAKGDIQDCLGGCALNKHPQSCANTCIQQKVKVSESCAACWVAEGDCTLDHCLGPCLDPTSAACKSCSKKVRARSARPVPMPLTDAAKNCFPSCVACTGIPEWAFPP